MSRLSSTTDSQVCFAKKGVKEKKRKEKKENYSIQQLESDLLSG